MPPHQGLDLVELILRESAVICHSDGLQPELGRSFVTVHMNVPRFRAVARKEEDAVGAIPQDCRTHIRDLAIVD
jgi:hypothetical protein